jgi:hypothetical protein
MAKRAVTERRHHFIRAFNRSRAVNGERDLSPLATIVIRQRLGGHPRNTNTTTLRFSFSSPSFFLSFFLPSLLRSPRSLRFLVFFKANFIRASFAHFRPTASILYT